jgi:predicted transcriptional regulator
MSPSEKHKRRIKAVFADSKYRLILSKIHSGSRPSEIAKQLGMSSQNIKYYTSNLMNLGLISKESDKSGLTWSVTERGIFILKQFIIQSVDYQTSTASFIHNRTRIPVRLHNISFSFEIISSLDNLRVRWEALRNGGLYTYHYQKKQRARAYRRNYQVS